MPRYSKLMIALHWSTALLVLAAWLTSEGGRHVRENPPLLHFSLGLAILLLVIPTPDRPADGRRGCVAQIGR